MNILLWILAILTLLLILLPFLKMKIHIKYSHNGKNDDLFIQFKTVFGLIKYTINVPVIAIDDESASIAFEDKEDSAITHKERKQKFTVNEFIDDIRKLERFLKHVLGFHIILRKFLKKTKITDFNWKTDIGVEDAALTGSTSGLVWMIKGNTIGILANYTQFVGKPDIYVTPHFQQLILKTSFSCMVSFRIGHAIFAGIKVMRHWQKGKNKLNKNNDQTAGRDIHV